MYFKIFPVEQALSSINFMSTELLPSRKLDGTKSRKASHLQYLKNVNATERYFLDVLTIDVPHVLC